MHTRTCMRVCTYIHTHTHFKNVRFLKRMQTAEAWLRGLGGRKPTRRGFPVTLLRPGLETASSDGRPSLKRNLLCFPGGRGCFLRGAHTSHRYSCGPAGPICNSSYQQSLPVSVLSRWYWLVQYKRCEIEVLVESS